MLAASQHTAVVLCLHVWIRLLRQHVNALNDKDGGVCQKKWKEIERSRIPATWGNSVASLRLIYVKWKVYPSGGVGVWGFPEGNGEVKRDERASCTLKRDGPKVGKGAQGCDGNSSSLK